MAVLDPLTSAFQIAAEPVARQLAETLASMFRDNLRFALIERLEAPAARDRLPRTASAARAARAPKVDTRRAVVVASHVAVVPPPADSTPPAPVAVVAAAPVERVVRTPIVIRVPPKRRRAERRSSEQIEILEQRILRALGTQLSLRLDAIADAIGAGRGTLTWPINRLITAGKIVASGEPGASEYALAPPPPPAVTRIIRRPAAAAPKVASEPRSVQGQPSGSEPPRVPSDQAAGLRPQPT